jgi:septum formation protein
MMRSRPRIPLYLASSSPRRRLLLSQAGIDFELLASEVDEETLTGDFTGEPEQLGQYLATAKALQARSVLVRQRKWGRILTADTTVLLDGRSLPKPRDAAEATAMLRQLRGREHIVATGVALAKEDGCITAATSWTRVLMRDYSDEELESYVATGDPLDKAGAYSIQHPGFQPVATIHGCYPGVVGLPLCIVHALRSGSPCQLSGPGCPWSAYCTAQADGGVVPPSAHPYADR